jgi:TonB family protein
VPPPPTQQAELPPPPPPPPPPPEAPTQAPAQPPTLAEPLPLPPPPVPPPPSVPRIRPPPQAAEAPVPAAPPPPPLAELIPGPPPPPQPAPELQSPPEREGEEDLPLPPPPMPAPPRPAQQPPRPQVAQPQPRPQPQRPDLPGVWMPDGARIQPQQPPMAQAPARPPGSRGIDTSLGPLTGRLSPEPELRVTGAQVGPDWRNAFRRWLEEHKRYPQEAIVLGQQGISRIELKVAPDGRVMAYRLTRRSGSPWLDFGTESMFRGAKLPAFPPGADPNGVVVDLTIHYILIRN